MLEETAEEHSGGTEGSFEPLQRSGPPLLGQLVGIHGKVRAPCSASGLLAVKRPDWQIRRFNASVTLRRQRDQSGGARIAGTAVAASSASIPGGGAALIRSARRATRPARCTARISRG
jgi:hypothetical protein